MWDIEFNERSSFCVGCFLTIRNYHSCLSLNSLNPGFEGSGLAGADSPRSPYSMDAGLVKESARIGVKVGKGGMRPQKSHKILLYCKKIIVKNIGGKMSHKIIDGESNEVEIPLY